MTSILEILPVEIIEDIIDIIAGDNDEIQYRFGLTNVKAFSLTCRALALRCRRHIFRSVKLFETSRSFNQPISNGKCLFILARTFAELITIKPYISDCVHELHYVLDRRPQEDTVGDTTVPSVPIALESLNHLRTLTISSETGWFDWSKIHSDSCIVLLKLMQRPTITSVTLVSIQGITISDLVACTHLRSFALRDDTTFKYDDVPPLGRPIQLRELNTDGPAEVPMSLLRLKYGNDIAIFDAGGIKKIELYIDEGEILDAAELLRLLSAVEDIDMFVSPWWEDAAQAIPNVLNKSLRTLRVLQFHLDIPISFAENEVANALRNLSIKNRIEFLKIGLVLSNPFSEPNPNLDWSILKECIIGLRWPCLTQVDLNTFIFQYTMGTASGPTSIWELQNSSITFYTLPTNNLLKFGLCSYSPAPHQPPYHAL